MNGIPEVVTALDNTWCMHAPAYCMIVLLSMRVAERPYSIDVTKN